MTALFVVAGLAACGGGGGGDSSGTTTAPRNGLLKGSAVKGLVKNGLVTIEQFRSGAWTRIDGTAVNSTDANGHYNADYSDFQDGAGPVKICVKGKPSGTTMLCDSIAGCGVASGGAAAGDANNNGTYDAGENVPVGEDFKLCTSLSGPPTGANEAPITLFTELVAQRAEQRRTAGENAATALANAASQIRSLAGGLDVLTVTPVDLTSTAAVNAASPDALAYAALSSAALARVVSNNGGAALNPKSVADFLNGEAGDGTISVSVLNNLLDGANAQLSGIGKSDTSGVLATLQAQSDAAEQACGGASSCEVSPTPVSDAAASRIDRAKALVQNVRNVVSGLFDLQQPAQTFSDQVDMARAILATPDGNTYGPAEYTIGEMIDVITVAQMCADEFVSGQAAPDDGGVNYTPGDCVSDGTHVHLSTADVSPFKAQSYTVKVTGGAAVSDPINVTVDNGAGGKGGYEDILVQLAFSGPSHPVRSTAQTLTVSLSGTVETDPEVDPGTGVKLTLPQGNSATLTKTSAESVDDGTGDIDFKKVASMALNLANVTFEQVRADASQAGGPVSFTGTIAGEVVRCTRQSCVDRQNAAPGSGPDAGDATFSPKSFTLAGTFANAQNSFTESATVNVANASSFDPKLNHNTSQSRIQTDNFPNATATISFDAALNGVPSAKVILTGTLNGIFVVGPDNIPNGVASLQILRDNQQVFRLQATTASNGDVTANVTDTAGAQLDVLFPNQADCGQNCDVGDIKVDATHTGDARTANGLLIFKYDDGTFDSF